MFRDRGLGVAVGVCTRNRLIRTAGEHTRKRWTGRDASEPAFVENCVIDATGNPLAVRIRRAQQ
jgi:hypothetical protein